MNYLVCDNCRYETREVTDRCNGCGQLYFCEWSPSWYSQPWLLASMGRSVRAQRLANLFLSLAAAFTAYGFLVHVFWGDREAWGNYLIFAALLAFCCYEVWAFTRGRRTSIDTMTHEPIPQNTSWRVFGLILDIALALMCAYRIASYDA
jgi:CDP-diglyceride synthetase